MTSLIDDENDLPDAPDEYHHCPKNSISQAGKLQVSQTSISDMKSIMEDLLNQVAAEYERQVGELSKRSAHGCSDLVREEMVSKSRGLLRVVFKGDGAGLPELARRQISECDGHDVHWRSSDTSATAVTESSGMMQKTRPNSQIASVHQLPLRESWNIDLPADHETFFHQPNRSTAFVPKLWYEPKEGEAFKLRLAASVNLSTGKSRFFAEQDTHDSLAFSIDLSLSDAESACGGWLHTVHPQNAWRVGWDLVTFLLIIMDLILIPLYAFDIEPNKDLREVVIFGAIFWSLDIFLSCITGIYVDGELNMRFGSIIKRYVKTWFLIDVPLVVIEWLVCLGEMQQGGKLATRSGRYTRIVKGFRAIKAARVFKLFPLLTKMEDSIFSLSLLFFFKIAKIIIAVLFLNHIIACVWYAVGKENEGWPEMDEFKDEPLDYLYLVSYHWAIAHFMGSILISGSNHIERVTATCTGVVALICSAMFISNVTNVMFTTQAIQDNRIRIKRLIYGYLEKNTLSKRLSARLKQFMRMYRSLDMNKEQESELMNILPQTLLADVRGEVRAPVLSKHPFLKVYGIMHPRSMVLICHNALQENEPMSGDIVFQAGDAAMNMYFIIGGKLDYTLCTFLESSRSYSYAMDPQRVPVDSWISEASLWVVWEHLGEFVAVDNAMIFAVHYQRFANVVQCHSDGLINSAMYAKRFQGDLQDGHISWTDMVPHDKLRTTVNEMIQQTSNRSSSSAFDENEHAGSHNDTAGVRSQRSSLESTASRRQSESVDPTNYVVRGTPPGAKSQVA